MQGTSQYFTSQRDGQSPIRATLLAVSNLSTTLFMYMSILIYQMVAARISHYSCTPPLRVCF